jgi:CheY-like chemotaxis protein
MPRPESSSSGWRAGGRGSKFVVAESARQGQHVAVTLQPRLIFLEDHLSESDSHDLLARLRRDPATAATPVVVLSANTGERIRSARAGAAAWFSKPLNIADFERTTMGLLELASAR